jgi:carboxyl-terminal processing protease
VERSEDAPAQSRTRYRTVSGRIVYDGGGITPDVIESDSAFAQDVRDFQTILARKVAQFRDALTDYARSLKGNGGVESQQFTVTPAMLDEVWTRMVARGVVMDRSIYDQYSGVASQLLAYDIARYVFGPEAEFKRRVASDRAIKTALEIATGATTQRELLQRALARQQQQLQPARALGGE